MDFRDWISIKNKIVFLIVFGVYTTVLFVYRTKKSCVCAQFCSRTTDWQKIESKYRLHDGEKNMCLIKVSWQQSA